MAGKKPIRKRGKISLSKYFQKFKEGESVAVIRERSIDGTFPKRLQGRTGVIEGKQGREYIVSIKDQEKKKKFLIKAVHLKKIKNL
jgi:ribosomal protein L21E